jgi:hypothetical protein
MNAHISTTRRIEADNGFSANLEGDSIVVRDPDGSPVLSHGPTGLRILAATGDLTLAAPNGRVIIAAGTDLEVETGDRLAVRSRRAEIEVERATLIAAWIETRCEAVVHRVGRWELEAERIAEHAVDVYRRVDGLVHVQAGRMRQLVDGAFDLLGRRVTIASDDDVSIDGKRVFLG